MTVTILRTDGLEEQHELTPQTVLLELERLLDAKALDTINLRDGLVLIVDDEGYAIEERESMTADGVLHIYLVPALARKPVNAAATALYHRICKPGVTHQVVGDAAVVRDKDFA